MNQDQQASSKDPEQMKFQLKKEGIRKFEIGLAIVMTITAYIRFYVVENVREEEQNRLRIFYTCLFPAIGISQLIPIKTIRGLNIKILIFEKLLCLYICYLTYKKSQESQSFQQIDQIHGFVAIRSSFTSCYMISPRWHVINIVFSWLLYALILLTLRGFEEIGVTLIGSILVAYAEIFYKTNNLDYEQNLDQLNSNLKDNQTLLKQVFHHLPEGVVMCKKEESTHFLEFWNASFVKLIGYEESMSQKVIETADEMKKVQVKISAKASDNPNLETSLYDHGHRAGSDDSITSLYNVIHGMKDLEQITVKILKTKRHLQVFKIQMLSDLFYRKILFFMTDITSIRDKQKQEIHQQLQSVFLSSISHDLKTPINQILSTTQHFQSREQSRSDQRIYKLQETSCNFMLSLIDDIIDLSKFQLRKFELSSTSFSFRELISEVEDLFEMKLQEKDLRFETLIREEVPEVLCLDRKRVKQIIMNLLSNALKFTMRGSIKLKAFVERRMELGPGQAAEEEEKVEGELGAQAKRYLVIQVVDSGVGISAEGQKKLFKLFGMLNKTKSINPNGTGLGLVICKQLCEAMGGTMTVYSQEGFGSTFTARIKIFSQVQEEEEAGSQDLAISQECFVISKVEDMAPLPELRVPRMLPELKSFIQECNECSKCLIIDDDSFNILALELLIDSVCGGKADSALSGETGLKLMSQKLQKCCMKPYEFVFVDLNMPLMNGMEVIQKARQFIQEQVNGMEVYKNCQFILCTAQSSLEKEEVLSKGFSHLVEKPVRKDEIEKIFGNRRTKYQKAKSHGNLKQSQGMKAPLS